METNTKIEDKLIDFLLKHRIASLATVSGKTPHATTIYYFVDDKLNFYFMTQVATMKHKNLKENPVVALAIFDEESLDAVQVSGVAEDSGASASRVIEELIESSVLHSEAWSNSPISRMDQGSLVFFKVKPQWIRWSKYTNSGDTVEYERRFE